MIKDKDKVFLKHCLIHNQEKCGAIISENITIIEYFIEVLNNYDSYIEKDIIIIIICLLAILSIHNFYGNIIMNIIDLDNMVFKVIAKLISGITGHETMNIEMCSYITSLILVICSFFVVSNHDLFDKMDKMMQNGRNLIFLLI